MAKNVGSKVFVWILLGMIIVGLIGFGSTNLGGTLRTIGSVGDKDLPIDGYARALQSEIRALEAQTGQRLSFGQAQLFGVDQQVLSRIVTARLLDAEAARLGISIGDETLRAQLIRTGSFQGVDGSFDRSAYQLALEGAGLTEREYETQVRESISSSLLQTALLGNLNTNPAYTNTFASYLTETRNVTWAQLEPAMLDGATAFASDSDLKAYYDDNIADFTLPETRQITYAWVTPDMMIDTIELDEQSLQNAYNERDAEFNTPERRLVERLIFGSAEDAQAAADRIDEGAISFDDLVAERGLVLSDIDLGDVSIDELYEAGDAVFADETLGVIGPVETDLGAALFRVNGILAAQSTSFVDALPLLRDELAYDRARRVIDAQISDFEDLLAAGATLEELAADTEMQLGQIGWHEAVSDGIAGYDAFRTEASVISVNDFPTVMTLADGGVFAMQLDAIDAARPEDFDIVRQQVTVAWAEQKEREMLIEKADAMQASLASGSTFEDLGLTATVETGLGLRGRPEGLPESVAFSTFELREAAEITVAEGDDGIFIVRLDDIVAADLEAEDTQTLISAIEEQTVSSVDQDVFAAFANAVRLRTDIELNQQAINAVHANFQ